MLIIEHGTVSWLPRVCADPVRCLQHCEEVGAVREAGAQRH